MFNKKDNALVQFQDGNQAQIGEWFKQMITGPRFFMLHADSPRRLTGHFMHLKNAYFAVYGMLLYCIFYY